MRARRPLTRLLIVLALVLGSGAAAVLVALGRAGSDVLAWWWPSAGIGSIAALVAPRRQQWWVVLAVSVASGLGSALAGRPVSIVVASVLAAAAETALIAAFLSARRFAQTSTVAHVARVLLVCLVASAAAGLILAIGSIPIGANVLMRFLEIAASHLSALVLFVPLALIVPRRVRAIPRWATVALGVMAVATAVLAFGPWGAGALTFLPALLLVWSAVADSMLATMWQVLLVAVMSSWLTSRGWGPFVGTDVSPGTLLQLYAVALATMCLLVGAQRSEQRALRDRLVSAATLLRGLFDRAEVGYAIVQDDPTLGLVVLDHNRAVLTLLPGDFWREPLEAKQCVAPSSPLSAAMLSLESGSLRLGGDEYSERPIPVTVTVDRVDTEELGHLYALTVRDLRPLREAEAAAQQRVERERAISESLRALNQRQDDFVASVSHELRTPITSILGYAQELEDEETDPRLRAYAAVITRNALRLAGLVDDVLIVSKPNRVSSTATPWTVANLVELARGCVEDLRYRIAERKLTVEVQAPDEVGVRCRPSELTRVIANLLTTAITFSPVGGAILLRITVAGAVARLSVLDHGPGIPEDSIPRVFERFYRSPQAIRDGVPGTGIGLAVAQSLAGEMGGRIDIGRGAGGGTEAVLTLPVVAGGPDTTAPR